MLAPQAEQAGVTAAGTAREAAAGANVVLLAVRNRAQLDEVVGALKER